MFIQCASHSHYQQQQHLEMNIITAGIKPIITLNPARVRGAPDPPRPFAPAVWSGSGGPGGPMSRHVSVHSVDTQLTAGERIPHADVAAGGGAGARRAPAALLCMLMVKRRRVIGPGGQSQE